MMGACGPAGGRLKGYHGKRVRLVRILRGRRRPWKHLLKFFEWQPGPCNTRQEVAIAPLGVRINSWGIAGITCKGTEREIAIKGACGSDNHTLHTRYLKDLSAGEGRHIIVCETSCADDAKRMPTKAIAAAH